MNVNFSKLLQRIALLIILFQKLMQLTLLSKFVAARVLIGFFKVHQTNRTAVQTTIVTYLLNIPDALFTKWNVLFESKLTFY